MKRIMIYAYTAHNLGDDLFIYILCRRYPETAFFLYAPKGYKQTFQGLTNLTIIPSDSPLHKINRFVLKHLDKPYYLREKIAKQCDAAVYIGGSLFMETSNWQTQLLNIKSMMQKDKPFFIIGANFGPFTSQQFYQEYEAIFAQSTDICFRDKYSAKLFPHLPNIRHAYDVVFQLEARQPLANQNYIVISTIYPSLRENLREYDDNYFENLASMAKTYIDLGYSVVFTSFCQLEKDHLAIDKIISLIPDDYQEQIHTYLYTRDMEEVLQLIARAKAIVASRFHAMILGFLFEKPTFPLVYSNKMTTVLEELDFKGKYWTIESLPKQIAKVHDFSKNTHRLRDKEIQSASEQFKALDQFLKD